MTQGSSDSGTMWKVWAGLYPMSRSRATLAVLLRSKLCVFVCVCVCVCVSVSACARMYMCMHPLPLPHGVCVLIGACSYLEPHVYRGRIANALFVFAFSEDLFLHL